MRLALRPVSIGLVCLLATLTAAQASAQGEDPNLTTCQRDFSAEAAGMPSTERIFGWVEQIVSFGPRRTGTPANAQSAAYVKCQFEALGLKDVHYEKAVSWHWEAKAWSLKVAGQSIESFPVAFSFITPDKPSAFATPPGGLHAELVDVGNGLDLDPQKVNVKGKIVVFDLRFPTTYTDLYRQYAEFIYDPEAKTRPLPKGTVGNPYQSTFVEVINGLMKAGAAGFVGVLADYFDSNKYYNELYGRAKVTIPGVWVTKRDGDTLRSLMTTSAGNTPAILVLEGQRMAVEARAVVGALPGKSNDTLLVTSHHDAVWAGAVEDASGVASVLAQAQYFASRPAASRQKTMLFVTMDSHFSGYQTHHAFVQKYIVEKRTPYNIVGDVTLEHIGKLGVTVNNKLVVTDDPEERAVFANISRPLRQVLKRAIIKNDLKRTAIVPSTPVCKPTGPGIPTDAFACVAGIPTASLVSGPAYLYDEADTLDKVAKDELLPVAKTFAELLEAMDRTPSAKLFDR